MFKRIILTTLIWILVIATFPPDVLAEKKDSSASSIKKSTAENVTGSIPLPATCIGICYKAKTLS